MLHQITNIPYQNKFFETTLGQSSSIPSLSKQKAQVFKVTLYKNVIPPLPLAHAGIIVMCSMPVLAVNQLATASLPNKFTVLVAAS